MFKHIFLFILYYIMSYNYYNYNRQLLSFYITQYNDILEQINYLYRCLDTTNQRIEDIYINELNNNRNYNNRNYNNRNYNNRNYNNNNNNRHNNNRNNNNRYNNNRNNNNRYNNNRNNNNNRNFNDRLRQNNTNIRDYNITSYSNTYELTNLLSSFLTDVPIIPSLLDITNSTRIVRYDSIISPLNESCPISLERFHNDDYVTQINYCGHIFKSAELEVWFQNNVRCPVCRYDIRSHNNTNRRNHNSTLINNFAEQIVSNLLNTDILNSEDLSNNRLIVETFLLHNPNSNTNSNNNTNNTNNNI